MWFCRIFGLTVTPRAQDKMCDHRNDECPFDVKPFKEVATSASRKNKHTLMNATTVIAGDEMRTNQEPKGGPPNIWQRPGE